MKKFYFFAAHPFGNVEPMIIKSDNIKNLYRLFVLAEKKHLHPDCILASDFQPVRSVRNAGRRPNYRNWRAINDLYDMIISDKGHLLFDGCGMCGYEMIKSMMSASVEYYIV